MAKDVKKKKPPLERAAHAIARMLNEEVDFDKGFSSALQAIKPLARRIHANLVFKRFLTGPIAGQLGIDTQQSQRVVESIYSCAYAMQILNSLARDREAAAAAKGAESAQAEKAEDRREEEEREGSKGNE